MLATAEVWSTDRSFNGRALCRLGGASRGHLGLHPAPSDWGFEMSTSSRKGGLLLALFAFLAVALPTVAFGDAEVPVLLPETGVLLDQSSTTSSTGTGSKSSTSTSPTSSLRSKWIAWPAPPGCQAPPLQAGVATPGGCSG